MGLIKDILFGFILPAYVTDWVCCYENDNGDLFTAMTMEAWDEQEDPTPAAVIRIKALSWLGIGWRGKPDSEPMEYDEWKAAQA